MLQKIQTYWNKHPEKRTIVYRFLRFGLVGIIASAIHYGIYALLIMLRQDANIAYTAGFVISLCCNYILTTYFTFRQNPNKRNVTGFIASHILNYFVEIALLNLFLWLGFSEWIAPILDMAIASFINFLVLQFAFLYKRA
ncbi:MAG: GtrA family protein [Bacteroidaceae bacterium]|nr:GtrA family protein [Bacteroidaceae bacterium]